MRQRLHSTYAGWSSAYRPTGIFFDEVEATTAYTSLYKGFANTVTSYSGFNFVCATQYVVAQPLCHLIITDNSMYDIDR